MKPIKELKQEIMEAHGELVAELEDQKFNLGPPDSEEMLVIDFDEVNEPIDNYHNQVIEKIEGLEKELREMFTGKRRHNLTVNRLYLLYSAIRTYLPTYLRKVKAIVKLSFSFYEGKTNDSANRDYESYC